MAKFMGSKDVASFKVSLVARWGKRPVLKVIEESSGKEVAVRSLSIDCPHSGLATLTMTVVNFEVDTDVEWDDTPDGPVTILPEP